jgi:hypothetical protein
MNHIWAIVILVFLTITGLLSIYRVLFDVWMTAYPFANAHEWRMRLCVNLAITVVIGLFWIALAIWLFRRRGQSKKK